MTTISHFPAIYVRHNCTKSFNLFLSRAFHSFFIQHRHSCRHSNPVIPNCILQNGSLHNPYAINEIVSYCAQMGLLSTGIQLHCHVLKTGFANNVHISTSLIYMYGKCSENVFAQQLFDEMPNRNVVTWNSLISGYVNYRYPETAIQLFIKMLRQGIVFTPYTISSALIGCSQLEDAKLGVQVHGLSLKAGFGFHAVAGSALIDMYAQCGKIENARKVFDRVVGKNTVTWNSMITGYVQKECSFKAMVLFREMLRSAVEVNYVTNNVLLSSFCSDEDLAHCKQVHCRVTQVGLESNVYLATTLMTVYSSSGCSLSDFYNLCWSITLWDQIAWNAVIAGFSNLGISEEALACFSRMRREGISVDFFTFTSLIKALGSSSFLEEGKQIHALVLKKGSTSNIHVQNGLVSMYGKCGKIDDAKKVFSSMNKHDVVSWNSMLTSCAQHGYAKEAIQMFEQMRSNSHKHRIEPNQTTFLAVLTACSHVGLLEKGLEYFEPMKSYDLLRPPKLEHYACAVDLYGRAGYVEEAEEFINSMPIEPGPSVYKALLSACQVHGNKEIAVRSAKKLMELWPADPAIYVLLANVLAIEGSWNDAANLRKLMRRKGVMKEPGYSWL